MEETLLHVKGMSCPSCVRHIQKALHEVEGVTQVEVKLREGQVQVQHSDTVAAGRLVEVLERAGYSSQPTP